MSSGVYFTWLGLVLICLGLVMGFYLFVGRYSLRMSKGLNVLYGVKTSVAIVYGPTEVVAKD